MTPPRVLSCSVTSDSADRRTVAHHAPLGVGFFRQEYWSQLPFPSPGDLPDPGTEPWSPSLQADTLTSEPPGKALSLVKESESESEVAQSCPTLCDTTGCSLPGSSVHGILQARILEWLAISLLMHETEK